MKYKIFKNNRGVITDRQPRVVSGALEFQFAGAKEGLTAVISTQNGATYYRELEDGKCSIPSRHLEGSIGVVLVRMNRRTPCEKIECEGIRAIQQSSGCVLILPDDANIPDEIVRLRQEMEELREEYSALMGEFDMLKESFEKMKEGYNIT